jgi:hypothetical protein
MARQLIKDLLKDTFLSLYSIITTWPGIVSLLCWWILPKYKVWDKMTAFFETISWPYRLLISLGLILIGAILAASKAYKKAGITHSTNEGHFFRAPPLEMVDPIQQHRDEVHKIAVMIDELITDSPQVKSCFTKHIGRFCKMMVGDLIQALRLDRQLITGHGAANKDEKLMCEYVLLAIVHDCMIRTHTEKLFPILGDKWPNRLDIFYDKVCEIFCYEKHVMFTVGAEPKTQEEIQELRKNFRERKLQLDVALEHIQFNLRTKWF